jgi:uncharacterized protein (TIGR01370 family)
MSLVIFDGFKNMDALLKRVLKICCAGLFLLLVLNCYAKPFSNIAFCYGSHPPADELRAFDIAIVDPSQRTVNPKKFSNDQHKLYAYVSVGEVERFRDYYKLLNRDWIIGENEIWQSDVLDQSNQAWRKFFVDKIITPLWQQGYRGFLLDTLDSYQLVAKTAKEKRQQEKGLIELIRMIKSKYPDAHLIFNRGFEILPKAYKLVDAVAAESLFAGWNQTEQKYQPVTEENRTWLLKQLKKIKKYKLPVIIIDYVNPADRNQAHEVAKKINLLGFIPWVTDGSLTSLGIGNIEVMPRKILMLYDGAGLTQSDQLPEALTYAAMPLEYNGYHPILYNVRHRPFPGGILTGRYAGILVWIATDYLSRNKELQNWLIEQKQNGIPVLILGGFSNLISKQFKQSFGITFSGSKSWGVSKIVKQSPLLGYEIKPFVSPGSFVPLTVKNAKILLQLRNEDGQTGDVVALTSWGGYAFDPFVITHLPNGQARWVINPLKFFVQALKLHLPVKPDATTENGRRLMLVHVDGDGFVNRAEWKPEWLSGQAMYKEIFSKYKIPATVSIIVGEISAKGIYPKLSREAEKYAREIFRLPWIEIANHSFSHPFIWPLRTGETPLKADQQGGWYLPLPNYKFNLNVEITDTTNYINNTLAPKGKRCKVFLWTGRCNPNEDAVALTYKDGLLNMNGGDTIITKSKDSLTNIAPLGVYRGEYYQVFAPNQNENIYTNLWRGPFYGYRRAIETFELTNYPLRLKPIDVYFHFYSASKTASLKALKTVFDWALAQPVMNIYASEYIRKVLDFNHLVIAKNDVSWIIINDGNLRELRVPKTVGYPDLKNSKNIIGFSSYGDDCYVHLGAAKKTLLRFTGKKPSLTYIKYANGSISLFERNHNSLEFTIKSYTPLKFALANMGGCILYRSRGRIMHGKKDGDVRVFTAKANKLYKFELICKKWKW